MALLGRVLEPLVLVLSLLLLYSLAGLAIYQHKAESAFNTQFVAVNITELDNADRVYVPNAEYKAVHPPSAPIREEDTEQVEDLAGTIAVIPKVWGYSEEEGRAIFPPYEYPRCWEKNPPDPRHWAYIDPVTGALTMQCTGEFPGKFVVGPIMNITFTNPKELYDYWGVYLYPGVPVPLDPTHEWVIASCNRTSKKYELFQHIPRFKPWVKRRAEYITETLSNVTATPRPKPLIVAVITVDSFSRKHFFRKLPKVTQFLNDLDRTKLWKVFDFKVHNIIGTDTGENQSRIFGSKWTGFNLTQNITTDLFGGDAIWHKFKKKGFVTLLGFDACAYKMHRIMGRRPRADHVVNSYFCANFRFSGYTSAKRKTPTQRCIGPHMSHYYLMNYTLEFLRLYNGTNQFIYNHMAAAHEQTGQHAATLDLDMLWYLKRLLRDFGPGNDLVVMLMADHGMRYGDFLTGTKAIQEHRLPAFFLLAQRPFLDSIENSYDVLTHNTLRLTTKPDIRRTLLYLSKLPYNMPIGPRKDYFVNIFTEKVENQRQCEDVEIPPWYCSDYVLYPIENSVFNASDPLFPYRSGASLDLGNLITYIGKEVVAVLNSRVYSHAKWPLGVLCRQMTFKEVILAIQSRVTTSGLLLKMILTVDQSSDALFDSWVLVSDKYDLEVPPMEQENYPPFPVRYQQYNLYAKIIMVYRADRYGGICEDIAREAEFNPEHCLCRTDVLAKARALQDV